MGSPTAVFTASGDEFSPSRLALGPWGPDTMSGRVVGGLAARCLEVHHGDPALLPARLTVDLLRPSVMAPLTATTERVREGRRIRIADVALHQGGAMVARASVVFLRLSEQPPGQVWTSGDAMQAPSPFPVELPSEQPMRMWPHAEGGDGAPQGLEAWQGTARKGVWIRENRPLVEGEELTPFVRAALAGDVTSALTHWGTAGLQFINADYTLTLSRLPDGPDIGMRAASHLSAEGVATGTATVFDRLGPLGTCTAIALANSAADFRVPVGEPVGQDRRPAGPPLPGRAP